jgi:serine/threonine protein kinase/Flp pilus assembly protein TadD
MVAQTVSHYKILEKLGEGGMGVVYKAQDMKLNRLVALKFLPPHFGTDADEKQRFIHEARAASGLDHPNICTIYEIDETEGGPEGVGQMFIAMAYYEGETLKKKIAQGGMSLKEIFDIAIQIAQGLSKAHQQGIVHRDLKPANVIIARDGVAKIVDFGLAKFAGQTRITKTGSTLGTAAYMSPEQALGQDADHRADIWSLGVILYEMLTGELPFKAEHEAALMYLIVNEQPPAPTMLDRKLPHHIDVLMQKLLAKDREARFQSMAELVQSLEAARKEIDAAQSPSKTKAIAVLPFDNVSPEKDSDYFSDGLTDELIANLSRLKDIRVVPRATSIQYKGTRKDVRTVGREMSVRYILSGSVRKFQDNLRITVELIDVETETQLWAETYKGKLADVFDIQEQVAKQIVDALMVKLTPTDKVVLEKRSTLSTEAFDCYLRARNFQDQSTKKSLQFAIQLFQRAIELDPRYAAAYAGLGQTYALMHERFDRTSSWLDKAIDVSLKAVMYDASLSDAYASLGLAYFDKKMIDEALTAVQKAIELDPSNYNGHWILGRIYHVTDRDREAVQHLKKALLLNPDYHTVYGDLMMAYERLGDTGNYRATLQAAAEFYPRFLSQHPDDSRARIFYAIGLGRLGRTTEAKEEAARAADMSPDDALMLYNVACFYGVIGEKSAAIDTLKRAIAAGFRYLEWIKRDPDLDNIRNESEYLELIKGK